MLPMWILAFPIWLVVFIVLYALATLYVAIKYREVRKFPLAIGAALIPEMDHAAKTARSKSHRIWERFRNH